MHYHRHFFYRLIEGARRFGFTVWTAILLLFIAAPVYAVFDGIGAGSAFLWAVMLMVALRAWRRHRGGTLPAFFEDPSGRRMLACYALLAAAIIFAAVMAPQ